MVRYDTRILNGLLDSYERSSLYTGKNKVAVRISFPFNKRTMPEYFDESSLAYEDIHSCIRELEQKGFLKIQWKRGKEDHIVEKVVLEEERAVEIYQFLKRKPKAEYIKETLKMLECLELGEDTPITKSFIRYLCQHLKEEKTVKEFIDFRDPVYTRLLFIALEGIEKNKKNCYIREFSIRLFGDSKTLESMLGAIGKIMRRFCQKYVEMDIYGILAEYSIYHTPNYVYLKGDVIVSLGEGEMQLDLSGLSQGIGLSGEDIAKVKVYGKKNTEKVVTIENLTTFFSWKEKNSLIIYLGGYHNSSRRSLLQMIWQQIPEAQYLHFGDIDVGGFEIYRDLCHKTGIPFQTYHMGINELEQYKIYAQKLTENDKKRLEHLLEKECDYKEVLQYMKKHDRKLEQECISVGYDETGR